MRIRIRGPRTVILGDGPPDGQRLFRREGLLFSLRPNMGQYVCHGKVDDGGVGWLYTIDTGIIYTWDITNCVPVNPQVQPGPSAESFITVEDIRNGIAMPLPLDQTLPRNYPEYYKAR
jgi:hypothetical protein